MKVLKELDLIIPIAILMYGILYYLEVNNLAKSETNLLLIEPVFFILALTIVIYIAIQLFNYFRGKPFVPKNVEEINIDWKKAMYFCITTVVYVFFLEYLGFILITLVYMLVLLWGLGVKSKKVLFLTPTLLVISLYISLEIFLNIKLPKGIFMFIGGVDI